MADANFDDLSALYTEKSPKFHQNWLTHLCVARGKPLR